MSETPPPDAPHGDAPDPGKKPSWLRVRASFESMLELGPEDRAEALDALARREPALAHEVARLLESQAASESSDFEARLGGLPVRRLREVAEEAEEAEDSLPDGGRVGPYRITERVGRGGTGSVYRAERVDGAYETSVAIKVLRRGLDTEDLLARFRAERQILASLVHPHIARLLDGGELQDGRPYLVMEFVEGIRIDEYCADHACSLEDRLTLVLQVCDAVAHAHRELVLHRDLKPSNIVVDAQGSVHLLDFGIGKLLDPEHLPGASTFTRTGLRVFTPDYAAPEQIRGDGAGVTTDVYQLGILLTRLLSGRSPYPVSSDAGLHELQSVILNGEIRPPSRLAAEPTKDDESDRQPPPVPSHQLRGDLDTIVLKALRLEPDQRYRSVDALAADLRAHLDGFPIGARPASLRYRFGKFANRNPAALTASVLGALLVVVLLAGSISWAVQSQAQAAELARERDRAEQAAATAEEVTEFLTDLFRTSSSADSDTLTARAVLRRGATDITETFEDRPRLKGTLLETMARAHGALGLMDDAIDLMDLRLQLLRADPDADRRDLADALTLSGDLKRIGGILDESEANQREALALWAELEGIGSLEWSSSVNNLGLVAHARGEFSVARDHFLTAVEIQESHPEGDMVAMARNLSNLGRTLYSSGEGEEAIDVLQRAVDILQGLEGQEGDLGITLNILGVAYRYTGRVEEAEEAYRASIESRKQAHGERHIGVGNSLNNLGVLLRGQGRLDEAIPVFEEALVIRSDLLGDEHGATITTRGDLGVVYHMQGDLERAEPLLRANYESRRHLERNDLNRYVATIQLAGLETDLGKYDAALRLWNEALPEGPTLDNPHPRTLQVLAQIGRLHVKMGQTARGLDLLERVVESQVEHLGEDHPYTERFRGYLAESRVAAADGSN